MTSLRPITGEFTGTPRFTILRRLGEGGMGVVYEAHDKVRNMPVALKTMQRMDPTALYRFKNEFRALVDVSHPNLAALYDFVTEDGQLFFTMELVDGSDFLTYVRGDSGIAFADTMAGDPRLSVKLPVARTMPTGRCDMDKLRQALRQLVSGISALHLAGKLHRDIKPSNVLVTPHGRVVLLDFGLVTNVGQQAGASRSVVGTAEYMSPEQASSGEVGEPTDWYSVGTMLYEALTGTLPFQGTFLQILLDKQRQDAKPPSSQALVAPDLDSLCVDLLRHDPSQRPRGLEILQRLGGPQERRPPVTRTAGTAETVFVGRDAHLESLREAFHHTEQGQAAVVWVHGSTGMGKSALLQRFVDSLTLASRVVVLSGRCYERENVAFKAFDSLVDALSGYLRRLPLDQASAILPVEILALTRVFPVLERVPAIAAVPRRTAPIADPQERRRRALGAFRELLHRVAMYQPLVLWLDDLQWGDTDSAQLLAEVLRPPDPPLLLVLLSYRTEEAEGSPFLTTLRDPRVGDLGAVRETTIEVGPLEREDAEQLATQLLQKPNEGLAKRIAQESQGSPYFVDELVRFAQTGDVVEGLPVRLDDALYQRISALPEEPSELLRMVVVAGGPISEDVVLSAADLQGAPGRRAVALLRAEHLIRSRRGGLDTFHDRVRETVLAHMAPEAKRGLHAGLAVALLAAGQNDPDVLTEHFFAAGDTEREAEFAQLAATKAEGALAFDRAVKLYERLLELGGTEDTAKQWGHKFADALHNAGRYASAAEQRLRLASTETDLIEAVALRRQAAEEFLCSGHFERGNALLEEVLRSLGYFVPKSPWVVLLALLVARIVLRLRGLRVRRVRRMRQEAHATDALVSAATGLGMTDHVRAGYFQARGLLRALDEGDPLRLVRLVAFETGFSATEGLRTRTRTFRLLAQTERLAEEVGLPHARGLLAAATGFAYFYLADWPRAREHLLLAVQIFAERCTGEYVAAGSYMLGFRAIMFMGGLRELSERVLPILRQMEAVGDLLGLANLRTEPLAMLRLAHDDMRVADDELRLVESDIPKTRFTVQSWYHLLCRVQLELYRDDPQKALAWIERQWRALRGSLLLHVHLVYLVAWDLRGRASVACAAKLQGTERKQRLAAVETIAKRLGRQGYGVSDGFAAQLRTGVLTLRGQRDEAARSAEEAQRAFEGASMKLHAAASRWSQGVLLGNAARIDEARAVFEGEHVRRPERFVAMLAPGVLP
jgi:serine/threonine protein kinase/tetratricopeptide (TPR) repeat protein